ncbi:hypothetical protein VNO80_07943 [Phaseolus coccineus]|uniref:Uncharacterized protein n=1 Tax=Phaseolus coccineus TaxID=3886 RepID=A0AAN9NRG1_PHACN
MEDCITIKVFCHAGKTRDSEEAIGIARGFKEKESLNLLHLELIILIRKDGVVKAQKENGMACQEVVGGVNDINAFNVEHTWLHPHRSETHATHFNGTIVE